jgi:hypothetical protein
MLIIRVLANSLSREWSGRVFKLVICGGSEESQKMRREDEINVGSVGDAF